MTADDYVRSQTYHDRTRVVPVVAAGPIIREPGCLPRRLVIRDLLAEVMVSEEVFRIEGDGYRRGEASDLPTHFYNTGTDYFPKGSTPDEALRLAWVAFADRNNRALSRLAEAEKVRRENAALVH